MPHRRPVAALTFALALLSIAPPATAQVTKVIVFVPGVFFSHYVYRYLVVNSDPTFPIVRFCVDFSGSIDDNIALADIVVPAGWELEPHVSGATSLCFKCSNNPPNGIPPGGALGGFRVPTVSNPTFVEGRQTFRVFKASSCAGPFAPIGGIGTMAAVFGATSTVPVGLDFAHGTSTGNPFAAGTSQKLLHVYDGALLPQGPIAIDRLAFRPDPASLPSAGGSFSSLTLTLATSVNDFTTLSATFAANLGADAAVVFSGPISLAPQPAPAGLTADWVWIDFAQPFVFDARQGDLAVQIEKCGPGNLTIFADAVGDGLRARTVRNLFSCSSPTGGLNNFAPVLNLGFEYAPLFQTNNPGAVLSVDWRSNNGLQPVAAVGPAGSPVDAAWSRPDPDPGLGFEIAVAAAPAVRSNQPGSLLLPNDHLLNVDVTDPSFTLLFNGAFPPFTPSSVPVLLPAGTVVAQIAVVDPAEPGGVALSAPNELRGTIPAAGTAPGPSGNDSGTIVDLAALGAPPITFGGVDFDFIKVMTNGRVLFVGGGADPTPTVAEAQAGYPMVGAWADFNASFFGAVTVAADVLGNVVVSYNGIPYNGQPGTSNAFSITFETATDAVRMTGLQGITPSVIQPGFMFLGMSKGSLGGATDDGAVLGFGGTSGAAPMPTSMLYAFGPPGTLLPGVDEIVFTPDGNANYGWTLN